jgi:hypothetical protein
LIDSCGGTESKARRIKGTGIGLAMVQRIVESAWRRDPFGKSTRRRQPLQPFQSQQELRRDANLIVEDEAGIAFALEADLRTEGYFRSDG